MASKEDEIKGKLYHDFEKHYFAKKVNKKAFSRLSAAEKEEFYREQKRYIEEEYQKIKYDLK
jgi:hypothetical protein